MTDKEGRIARKSVHANGPTTGETASWGMLAMPLADTRTRFHGRMPEGNGEWPTLAQARNRFSITVKGAAKCTHPP
jgi:hypothetical protein